MLEYRIAAHRIDGEASLARARDAEVRLGTGLAGPSDALNPVELLLAAIAACMIKGIERVTPLLGFRFSGVDISLHAVRQDAPPRIVSVDYEITVDTDESDQRLELLHKNIRKYGTISNTVAAVAPLEGTIRRKS